MISVQFAASASHPAFPATFTKLRMFDVNLTSFSPVWPTLVGYLVLEKCNLSSLPAGLEATTIGAALSLSYNEALRSLPEDVSTTWTRVPSLPWW